MAIHFHFSQTDLLHYIIFTVTLEGHLLDSLCSLRAKSRKKQPMAWLLILIHKCPFPLLSSPFFPNFSISICTAFPPQFVIHSFLSIMPTTTAPPTISNETKWNCLISHRTCTLPREGNGIWRDFIPPPSVDFFLLIIVLSDYTEEEKS